MKLVTVISAALTIMIVAFFVTLFLVKIIWSWTMPDLFPGAVAQGLVAKNISWLAALKIAIFVAVLSGLIRTKTE